MLKRLLILGTLTCLSGFIILSFSPRARFAQPKHDRPAKSYWCTYHELYNGSASNDIMFMGASRTNQGAILKQIAAALETTQREQVELYLLHTPWSNIDMQYFLFKEYIKNNQAPKAIFLEVMHVTRKPGAVAYTHPLLTSLAPFELYLDVLRPNSIKANYLYNVSDFLRLLIEHVDLSLSRLLVKDLHFLEKGEGRCKRLKKASSKVQLDLPDFPLNEKKNRLRETAKNYRTQLETEFPNLNSNYDALLEIYSDRKRTHRLMMKAGPDWQSKVSNFQDHFKSTGERDLYYYRKIVELAKQAGIKVILFRLPNLLDPEVPEDQLEIISEQIGVPVVMIPYADQKAAYPYYADERHLNEKGAELYSYWFAEQIVEALEN